MTKTHYLTAEYLREQLGYNAETGEFTWRTPGKNRKVGRAAGCVSKVGYIKLRVAYELHQAHRLAFLWMTGNWPAGSVDHIDGNPSNNRWANLRDVGQSINMQNSKKARSNNKSGMLGVCANRNGWRATITLSGKQLYLGTYKSPELAHEAYLAAKRKMHAGNTL